MGVEDTGMAVTLLHAFTWIREGGGITGTIQIRSTVNKHRIRIVGY